MSSRHEAITSLVPWPARDKDVSQRRGEWKGLCERDGAGLTGEFHELFEGKGTLGPHEILINLDGCRRRDVTHWKVKM